MRPFQKKQLFYQSNFASLGHILESQIHDIFSSLDIDPCYQVDCGPYKYCQVNEADMTYSCICNNCTSSSSKDSYSQQVCDSDGVTHNSRCELDREICLGNTNATWVHDGPCPREQTLIRTSKTFPIKQLAFFILHCATSYSLRPMTVWYS